MLVCYHFAPMYWEAVVIFQDLKGSEGLSLCVVTKQMSLRAYWESRDITSAYASGATAAGCNRFSLFNLLNLMPVPLIGRLQSGTIWDEF